MLSKAIRRYSLALYEAARDSSKLKEVAQDAENLNGLVKSSSDLRLFFQSPVINKEKKEKVVTALFKGKISDLTFDFIKLLVKNNRENLLVEILDGYLEQKNNSEGKIKATVKTAIEIGDSEKNKITEKINTFTGMNSIPEFTTQKDLIGGFTIQVKDIVIDASIKRQLENLRNKFKEVNIK